MTLCFLDTAVLQSTGLSCPSTLLDARRGSRRGYDELDGHSGRVARDTAKETRHDLVGTPTRAKDSARRTVAILSGSLVPARFLTHD